MSADISMVDPRGRLPADKRPEDDKMNHPAPNCPQCPRLVAFREANQGQHPDFFNGAVPSFGSIEAKLLVVGLAPGLKGANATGRPFTGDYAGDVLYPALKAAGLATGNYDKRPDDGLELIETRITNAVRCVPPENKPTGPEINECNPFLTHEIQAMPNLKVLISLGGISHKAILKALGMKQSAFAFGHASEHPLEVQGRQVILLNSYHTSRYNMNTGRLTEVMFEGIVARAAELINIVTPAKAGV